MARRIVPDWEWSWGRFFKNLKLEVAGVERCKKCTNQKGWEQQPGPFQQSLQRYRIDKHHKCDRCASFTNRRSMAWDFFHVLGMMIPDEAWLEFEYMLGTMYQWTKAYCEHELRRAFKKLTGLMKLGGEYITPHWRHYPYWDNCFGYVPYAQEEDLEDEVVGWLVTPNVNGAAIGEEQYHLELYEACVSYLKRNWVMPAVLPTVKEWVARGSWMRGRGGTSSKATIKIGDKYVRSRSNKGVSAVFLDDADLEREMFRVTPQRMFVLQKSEPSKIRGIVKTDNENFRKMDFLSLLVEGGLKRAGRTTLLCNSGLAERIDDEMLRDLKSGLNVPLDQSAFDNHQGKPSIRAVMKAIYDVCFALAPQEYRDVWATMWDSFFHESCTIKLGDKFFPWGNGVASGWRWTALLDTLLNIASFDVLTFHASHGRGHTYWASLHQGDDIHFKASSVLAVTDLIKTYNDNGYEVHSEKTYVSRCRTEFLRRSYESGRGIVGYIGRTIHALMYRNPVSEVSLSKIGRAYNRLSTMMLLLLRGARVSGVMVYLREDCRQLGLDLQDLVDFYLTPNAVGGGGVAEYTGPLYKLMSPLGSGRWLVPKVEELDKPAVRVPLGAWQRRIDRSGVPLDGDTLTAFARDLSRSWGVETTTLSGRVREYWVEVPKLAPLAIIGGVLLPNVHEIWDDDTVPVLLGNHWRGQLIKDGNYTNYIKQEHRPTITQLSKKISKGLLETYLMGTASIPSPIVDGISQKYGNAVKLEAEDYMYRAIASSNATRISFMRKMLWLETWMARKLGTVSPWTVMAF